MRSIIATIILFLGVIALTSFVAIADGSEGLRSVMLDVSPGIAKSAYVIRFTDGDTTCYMPTTRSGISCLKN